MGLDRLQILLTAPLYHLSEVIWFFSTKILYFRSLDLIYIYIYTNTIYISKESNSLNSLILKNNNINSNNNKDDSYELVFNNEILGSSWHKSVLLSGQDNKAGRTVWNLQVNTNIYIFYFNVNDKSMIHLHFKQFQSQNDHGIFK